MSIADDAAQRFLAYLGRMEQLYGSGGPAPAHSASDDREHVEPQAKSAPMDQAGPYGPPDEDAPRMSDAQGGIHPLPDGPTITAAPTYPMDQAGPYGPPDEDAPRMGDAQGGIHPLPDGPTIKSARTYPMDDQ